MQKRSFVNTFSAFLGVISQTSTEKQAMLPCAGICLNSAGVDRLLTEKRTFWTRFFYPLALYVNISSLRRECKKRGTENQTIALTSPILRACMIYEQTAALTKYN